MNAASPPDGGTATDHPGGTGLYPTSSEDLAQIVAHAAHLLPSQGPITVFVHHNPLHSFEQYPFHEAVRLASETYGSQPYLPEAKYRTLAEEGRVPIAVLFDVLEEDLGGEANRSIGVAGTRLRLRSAMLEHPLRLGSDAELRWLIAETDALHRFRREAPRDARERVIAGAKAWVADEADRAGILGALMASHRTPRDARGWEAFTLELLWRVCRAGVHGIKRFGPMPKPPIRHRDLLQRATGRDSDLQVHEVLIRFCACFLDQGFADWPLPDRSRGFFKSFMNLYREARLVEPWLRRLPAEIARIEAAGLSAEESAWESLGLLGIHGAEVGSFVTETLLVLRGWAGMIWQMETNAEWAIHPAPRGTLLEFLAVRLILERLATEWALSETMPGEAADLAGLRDRLRRSIPHALGVSVEQRAYLIFQLAEVCGWSPRDLHDQSKEEWTTLVHEIEAFSSLERRRVYQIAYERTYRDRALDALAGHEREPAAGPGEVPSFQVVLCLDEREESFRRHLEEVEPACETFGVAGFFGVSMYYRGVADAHFRPLCPINVKPRHYIEEGTIHSFEDAGRVQADIRRRLGNLANALHRATRTAIGGSLLAMVGAVASAPMLMRLLHPRATARLRRSIGRLVTPPLTQLRLERFTPEPFDAESGYSVQEMAEIVASTLHAIGLTGGLSPLVLFVGHGSSSHNNPQRAAYDCGACGGAPGGPNARAFAQMANDARVRRLVAGRGITIPDDTHFLGAFHNTCDDGLTYSDLDHMPARHREFFRHMRACLSAASTRNAHERCRRFDSAPTGITPEEARKHVETRAEDLSQTRPELGHATNALCVVGRRERTRGLFLDRRCFLASYDPTQDGPGSPVLAGLLSAVIPVCSGINLEYFFGAVDNLVHGCGTKLPHNLASLLGVMDGAASDLRPGLSWQMVEIHEPMRLLCVVETTPDTLAGILAANPTIDRLARNEWMQLATLDPGSGSVHLYRNGKFSPHEAAGEKLPRVSCSAGWYGGQRDHLGFAAIVPDSARSATDSMAADAVGGKS